MTKESKVYDFTKMNEFPAGWEKIKNNVNYAFDENGVTISPTGLAPHWFVADKVPLSDKTVIKLLRNTAFVSDLLLGWMAQGTNMATASFGLKIDGSTGELIAQAGDQEQGSGVTYVLSEISAVYVQRPTSTQMVVTIEKTDGSLYEHTLNMPSTTYSIDKEQGGFLIYVTDASSVTLSSLTSYPPDMPSFEIHDFTKMSAFPGTWEVVTNNVSYAFGLGGLTITSTGSGYHWMFVDEIPAHYLWCADKKTLKLNFASPPVDKVFLGWMAQGENFGNAWFGLRINEDGELLAHAGIADWESGIFYTLSEIKAIYVQLPSADKLKVAIEKSNGDLQSYLLDLPDTTYTLDTKQAGFLIYVKDPPSKVILSFLTLSSRQLTTHAFTDPKKRLVDLLSAKWLEKEAGFTPKFSTDWYDRKEEMPQVVVSHMITPSRFLGIGQTPKRFDANYTIGVWSKGDNEKRNKMIHEIDRILKENFDALGLDIDIAHISSWRDLDEVDVTPKIYRSQILVRLLYFKS